MAKLREMRTNNSLLLLKCDMGAVSGRQEHTDGILAMGAGRAGMGAVSGAQQLAISANRHPCGFRVQGG